MTDIVETLSHDIDQLRRMVANADLAGQETGVRVKNPVLLIDLMSAAKDYILSLTRERDEAASEIESLRRELAEARKKAVRDRVDFIDGNLDEIVSTNGAHLEHMGGNRWFLLFSHEDGTKTAVWFGSKDLRKPFWESRPRPDAEKGEKG